MEQGMLFDKIKKIGIVPVVKLEDAQESHFVQNRQQMLLKI